MSISRLRRRPVPPAPAPPAALTPLPSPQGPPETLQQAWLGGWASVPSLGCCTCSSFPQPPHLLPLLPAGGASPSTVKAGGKETGPFSACLVSASWQLTLSVALPRTFTQHLLGAQVCLLHLSDNDNNSSSFLIAVTQCCVSALQEISSFNPHISTVEVTEPGFSSRALEPEFTGLHSADRGDRMTSPATCSQCVVGQLWI